MYFCAESVSDLFSVILIPYTGIEYFSRNSIVFGIGQNNSMKGQLLRELFGTGYDVTECPFPEEGRLGVNATTILFAILDLVRMFH